MRAKKAEMGVGTLIIFIAMLLVAAVAAGVLIQTAGSLQEKALSTGSQAKGQIATNVRVIEVSATNGENGSLIDFELIAKLAPGSNPVKIGEAIFTANTYDKTATLQYRGTSGTLDNSLTGFQTYREEQRGAVGNVSAVNLTNDLDDDGSADTVIVYDMNDTSNDLLIFTLSTAGQINISLGANITNAGTVPVVLDLSGASIADADGTEYGTVTISGTTSTNSQIDESVNFTIVPENEGQGYFAVEYLQQGSNWVNGNLQRGDVIKIYFEAPRDVGEAEEMRLNFIPKIGTATLTQFVTPEVISTERVYLYP